MSGSRKLRKASWRELPPAEMADHLLATPTISDRAWTSQPRLPREARSDFVRRVLLGETPASEPRMPESEPEAAGFDLETAEFDLEAPEAEAAELVAPQSGYFLLNTDGGNAGNPLGGAAIGALLRTRRLVILDQLSQPIAPATHNVAEYRALIEGLKLARRHGVQHIRVYMDSALVVDQVHGYAAVKHEHLKVLHKDACALFALFKSFRIAWVPREMNAEADQLVKDALRRRD